jgi:hypothetical protein
MKCEWAKEAYTVFCTRNERNGTAWFKTGIWMPRRIRKESEKGTCPLCSEDEDVIHIESK